MRELAQKGPKNMTDLETIATADNTATISAHAAQEAPRKPRSKKHASVKKETSKATTGGKNKSKKPAKPKGSKPNRAKAAAGSKQAEVLELMRRKQGVSLAEIMRITGWQAHTVRGFISGAIQKKLGVKVESFRNEGERTYRATE